MYPQIAKPTVNRFPAARNESRAVANSVGQHKSNSTVRQGTGIVNSRPDTIQQRDSGDSEKIESITQNLNINHSNNPTVQCGCSICNNSKSQPGKFPMSNHYVEKPPVSSNVTQLAITADGAAGAGNDTTINTYLSSFSGGKSGTANLWDSNLKKAGMGDRKALNTTSNNTAMSVAVNSSNNEFRTEGSISFNDTVKGTSSEDVQRLGTRSGGEHSEVYLYNKGHTSGSIACAIDNCFFCNNFLELKGITHDEMKQSWVFPEMWEPPGKPWRIVKETKNKHEMDPNKDGKRWTIDNPQGGTKGVYFDEANQK